MTNDESPQKPASGQYVRTTDAALEAELDERTAELLSEFDAHHSPDCQTEAGDKDDEDLLGLALGNVEDLADQLTKLSDPAKLRAADPDELRCTITQLEHAVHDLTHVWAIRQRETHGLDFNLTTAELAELERCRRADFDHRETERMLNAADPTRRGKTTMLADIYAMQLRRQRAEIQEETMSNAPHPDPTSWLESVRDVIARKPGITTAEIGDALGQTITEHDNRILHSGKRSLSLGQDGADRWFAYPDNQALFAAYLAGHQPYPGAEVRGRSVDG